MTSCQGRGGTGTLYTYAQLMGLWIGNGGPVAVAPIAGAIAEAESGGCSTALNPTDNGGRQSSFGLWQISNGTHSPPAANIYDPNVNARQAVLKYQGAGNDFTPWGTYNSGAYKNFLSPGTSPDTSAVTFAAVVAATDSGSASGGSDCALSLGGQHIGIIFGHGPSLPSACLITKSEIRAILGGAIILAGAVPMMLGAIILSAFAFRASGAQSAIMNAASAVPTPAGKVATAGAARGAAAHKPRTRGPRSTPQGRHAKTGPNAPAQGRHARPAG